MENILYLPNGMGRVLVVGLAGLSEGFGGRVGPNTSTQVANGSGVRYCLIPGRGTHRRRMPIGEAEPCCWPSGPGHKLQECVKGGWGGGH